MISSFTIKNFRSIIDETISFKTNKRMPNGFKDAEEWFAFSTKKYGEYNPVSAFWGSNATGKTNIIRGLKVFSILIKDGELIYEPNKLITSAECTTFTIELIIGESKYKYTIEYNRAGINNEMLSKDNKVLFSHDNFKNIITKIYDLDKIKEIFNVEACENTIQKVPFLKVLNRNYRGLNESVTLFGDFINKKLKIYFDNTFFIGTAIVELSLSDNDNDIQEAFNNISNVLKNLDIDIESMKYEKIFIPTNNMDSGGLKINRPIYISGNTIKTYHKNIRGDLIQFNFKDESRGTQQLFGIIGVCLKILEDGAVLIIDELERSIHPLLLKEIVKLFKSKYYNKNNAQLIFVTHSTDILDDDTMRVNEINIVDKTLKKGTFVKRLDTYRDNKNKPIRNVTNFRKLYLNGNLGGIPHASI
jgi:AAA15 family ATPase/GTPase